jgi:hypothetical protein
MNPKRESPASTHNRPERIASRPARATASASLPAAKGRIAAAISGAREESGPRTRILLGPTRAYTTSGMIVA